jgi:hypothetical protein
MIRQSLAINAPVTRRLRPVPLPRQCATIAGCMVIPLRGSPTIQDVVFKVTVEPYRIVAPGSTRRRRFPPEGPISSASRLYQPFAVGAASTVRGHVETRAAARTCRREDHEDDRLLPAKSIGGSDRIKWYVGIEEGSELGAHMDLVEAAHDAN